MTLRAPHEAREPRSKVQRVRGSSLSERSLCAGLRLQRTGAGQCDIAPRCVYYPSVRYLVLLACAAAGVRWGLWGRISDGRADFRVVSSLLLYE